MTTRLMEYYYAMYNPGSFQLCAIDTNIERVPSTLMNLEGSTLRDRLSSGILLYHAAERTN
jgi:hypothetical protein